MAPMLAAGVTAIASLIAPALACAQMGEGFAQAFQGSHHGVVDVTARKFVYDSKTDTFVAIGDAVVTQNRTVLTADQVTMQQKTRMMDAVGNVHLVDPLGNITAKTGKINLDDETADLTDATITDHYGTYRLEGTRVIKKSGQRYHILDGFFTTCGCDPGTPDWSITSDEMDVHLGDEATAKDPKFDILGYPIMGLPFGTFPIDTDRHSGLLAPRLGESGLRGAQIVQPYYYAINKSSDATVALDVETSQRVGLLGEYRLINGDDDFLSVDGAFYNESLRSEANRQDDIIDNQIADDHIPLNRYDVIGMMRQHLTDDWVLYGNGLTVSDSLELREMNVWTLSRTVGPGAQYPYNFVSMRDALGVLGTMYSYDNGYADVHADWNQDLIQPQEFALQSLPTALLSGRQELLGGLMYSDYDFSATNFWRAEGQSGTRIDLFPRVTLPWRLGDYLYGYGTLAARETVYDTSGHVLDIIPVGQQGLQYNNGVKLGPLGPGGLDSREMLYGSAGVASEIERVYDLNWKYIEKIKHTFEPFVNYSYIPSYGQNDLPLYDETDRIEPRNMFTYGFTTRILAKLPALLRPSDNGDYVPDVQQDSTISPFRAQNYGAGATTELFRFTMEQVYDLTHNVAVGGSHFSAVDLTGQVFPTRVISFGSQFGYYPQNNQISYANAYVNFQPWWTNNRPRVYTGNAEEGSFMQLSYNYVAPGPNAIPGINSNYSQFLVLRSYYDLFSRLGVYFAPSYDFVDKEFLSTEYGVRLKSPCDCWSFDMGITKTNNPSETSFQFQLTLGGLGSIGESPFGRNPFQQRTSLMPNYGAEPVTP
ncbi:MAG TPA: LPS assembly protein LptD [Candidatus Binataceae bacterium]|nr:LPS assembly protein LptD [Candidatus Binataceae bacterium]